MSEHDIISKRAYRNVVVSAAGLALLYALMACYGMARLGNYKEQTMEHRERWMENTVPRQDGKTPGTVLAGIYVNRITDIDVRGAGWTADFDIWFRSKNKELIPGESFQITNGEIEEREKRETRIDGGDHYERYRVKARMAKRFDPARFPFSNEPLVIAVENDARTEDELRFVADTAGSGVSPTAELYDVVHISQVTALVRSQEIESPRGILRDGDAGQSNRRSQFVLSMLVDPPGALLHFTLFHVLFASVAIALLALFVKPTHVDPRFGLGTGAVFAAVGNFIVTSSSLPRAQQATLADMINIIGLSTIFLTLVQSAISLYLYDSLGLEKLSRFFDKVFFVVFAVGYVGLNIALPLAAK